MTRANPWVLMLLFLTGVARAEISLSSLDDFRTTAEGWLEGGRSPNPPTWSGDPGWDGVTNGHLINISDGSGSGGKLQMRNTDSRWTGNYIAAGVHAISLWVDNRTGVGSDLPLRIAFNGPGGWFASIPQTVSGTAATNEWRLLTFPLGAADLTFVQGSAGDQVWSNTLSAVSTFQILVSAAAPGVKHDHLAGSEIVAHLRFDDIRAVPAPPPPRIAIAAAEVSDSAVALRWGSGGDNLDYTVESRAGLTTGDWSPAPPTSQWPIVTTAWTNAGPLETTAFFRILATPRR